MLSPTVNARQRLDALVNFKQKNLILKIKENNYALFINAIKI
jgi:hypothetical protein